MPPLCEQLEDMLCESGFLVVGSLTHYFQPYGHTALWLLGESHLAVHTFPEDKKTYIQLSSCNRKWPRRYICKSRTRRNR